MNYITDVFLDRAIIKQFSEDFLTSLDCLYNLIYVPCRSRWHFPPQAMRSFSDFVLCSLVNFVI